MAICGDNVESYERESGWDKYCDEFQILSSSNGDVLATRILAHPHANEQPFTRSSNGAVALPENVMKVTVVARDSVCGYCGTGVSLELPAVDDVGAFADPSSTSFIATQAPTTMETANDGISAAATPTVEPSAAAIRLGSGVKHVVNFRWFLWVLCGTGVRIYH